MRISLVRCCHTIIVSLAETSNLSAITSADVSHNTFGTEPDRENDRVRGSYISGLTAKDMTRLDTFESGVRLPWLAAKQYGS